MDTTPEALGRIIARFYDAALDGDLWMPVARSLAAAFDSTSAAIQVRDEAGVNLLGRTDNITDAAVIAYAQHFHQVDVWYEGASRLGVDKVFSSRDLVSDVAFERTEYYQDWARHNGQFYVMGSVLQLGKGLQAGIGIHRPKELGNFTQQEIRAANICMPHLRRALQLSERLGKAETERDLALGALERVGLPTVVAEATGRVVYANSLAEQILLQGEVLTVRRGTLGSSVLGMSAKILTAVRNAALCAQGVAVPVEFVIQIPRPPQAGRTREPLIVIVSPFPAAKRGLGHTHTRALLFLKDSERVQLDAHRWRQIYGLTPAEASVSALLCEGITLPEICARLGTSANTVRTHLRHAYSKTGVHRQAALVQRLLGSNA